MRYRIPLLWIIIFQIVITAYGQSSKKLGLTLSGGGARGLAHIGILKAIDSAGLKVDYLTGTSMGSIVGGLYAAGYTANEIEQIARSINWGQLLSNSIPMTSYDMVEKGEFNKYAVELPVDKWKVGLPSGFLESQELWLTLEKYFFPVAHIRDFNQLPIPFRCIGANLVTGNGDVFSSGSLVRSIRASMAIPGAFSPVKIGDQLYCDGGIVRNLPVRDVKAMGADYVIAVSVSTPLYKQKELNSAVKVLTQAMFLSENKDFQQEIKLSNHYVDIPLGDFTTGSFDSGNDIIDLGIEEGKRQYPYFKHLADSLRAAGYLADKKPITVPQRTSYRVLSSKVVGLDKYNLKTFKDHLKPLDTLQQVEASDLEMVSRQAFATRMFKSITYEIIPNAQQPDACEVLWVVQPEADVMMKAGLQQNTLTGFGIHLNLTLRNRLTPRSRTFASVNMGQNWRALLEHTQFFSRNDRWSNRTLMQYQAQELPTYNNFKKTGLYNLHYYQFDNRVQYAVSTNAQLGVGVNWQIVDANPQIESGLYYEGRNRFFQGYGFWQHNSFNRPVYPKNGWQAFVQAGYTFGLNPAITVFQDGNLLGDLDDLAIPYNAYWRTQWQAQQILPLHRKWAWQWQTAGGINFGKGQSILNTFIAGGMNPTIFNQVQAVGFQEGEIIAESMALVQTGPRWELFNNAFLTANVSWLAFNLVDKGEVQQSFGQLWGAGVTAGYVTPIGPIEITISTNSSGSGLRSYFNLGFPFKL